MLSPSSPPLDVILNPAVSTIQKLALFTIPGTTHVVYLNSFVPSRVHYVWSVFALSLLFLFLIKGVTRNILGSTLIQYVGLAGVTDLRNSVYAKVVQQPVGFFQHNPVGRVMSAVISDIEQMRSAFSDWLADFCPPDFHADRLRLRFACALTGAWPSARVLLIPLVVLPVSNASAGGSAAPRKRAARASRT